MKLLRRLRCAFGRHQITMWKADTTGEPRGRFYVCRLIHECHDCGWSQVFTRSSDSSWIDVQTSLPVDMQQQHTLRAKWYELTTRRFL